MLQEGDHAVQLYYIRPRFGDFFWDTVKATKLRVMLEAAIQRRFPKGLKVCADYRQTKVGEEGCDSVELCRAALPCFFFCRLQVACCTLAVASHC